MKKISITDFKFEFAGYGHYYVTYTSSITGKNWSTTTDNMPLIDKTINDDNPTQKNLQLLKNTCKHIN